MTALSVSVVLSDLGTQCGTQGRYSEAHTWLTQSVSLAKSSLPPHHPAIGWGKHLMMQDYKVSLPSRLALLFVALYLLANCCIKSGKPADGRLALEEALEVAGVSCDDRLCAMGKSLLYVCAT